MTKTILRRSPMNPALAVYRRARLPLIERSLRLFPRRVDRTWLSLASSVPARKPSAAASALLISPVALYLSRGGKLLRSLLSCLVLEALGRKPAAFLPLVGMMEIMESDTIMIDDIIDSSPERRGGPSAHVVFGTAGTIIAGGFFYYASWHLACLCGGVPESARLAALEWLTRRHLLTSVGQTEEIVYLLDGSPLGRERYFQEISARISVLSFSGPLVLPAICAGAPAGLVRKLDDLGKYMGLAYHLHGDELNLFPRSGTWGKATGDDITSGTQTYLLACALRGAGRSGRSEILSALGRRKLPRARLEKVTGMIASSGALRENRLAIDGLARKAGRIIASSGLGARWSGLLENCLRYMAYDREK